MYIGLWQDAFDDHFNGTQDTIQSVDHRRRRNFAGTQQAHPDEAGDCFECPDPKIAQHRACHTASGRFRSNVQFAHHPADSQSGKDYTAKDTHVVHQLEHQIDGCD